VVARLVYAATSSGRDARRGDPAPLPSNPLPARMDLAGALRRELAVGDPAAKDVRAGAAGGDFGRALFTVARGRTVSLALANRGDAPAVVHPHGHACRLLDRLDDGWKPFWLDTVVVPPRSTQRIAFVADNPGKWLIEERVLGGMAVPFRTWFKVT
jgi:FtsP/CotA-like multicopper oxidase with cupredoxin domain